MSDLLGSSPADVGFNQTIPTYGFAYTGPSGHGSALQLAMQQSEALLDSFFAGATYSEQLFSIFGNAGTDPDVFAQRVSSIASDFKLEDLLTGITLISAEIMGGAYGAFASAGPNGEASRIFLNADWASQSSVDAITGVLLEEYGHAVDYYLNRELDSPGDEGDLFSRKVRNMAVTEVEMAGIFEESDHIHLTYQGTTWLAEAALTVYSSNSGPNVNQYVGFNQEIEFDEMHLPDPIPSGPVLLNLYAYDVDWDGTNSGENNEVFLYGPGLPPTSVGLLNGFNERWTWSTFDVTNLVTQGGDYGVLITPDIYNSGWKVTVSHASLTTGTTNGNITNLTVDVDGKVNSTITVDTQGDYGLTYYLIDANNVVVSTYEEVIHNLQRDTPFANGPDQLSGGALANGTYKLRAVLAYQQFYIIEDIATWTVVKNDSGITTTDDNDTVPPTVTITSSNNVLKIGDTTTVTFTFSEDIKNFTLDDVTAPNGTFGTLSGKVLNDDGTFSYSATFTPNSNIEDASNQFVVGTDWSDLAGNAPTATTSSPNYSIDTVRPTIAITSDKLAMHHGQTSLITFTLSEDSTGFARNDVAVSGGSLTQWKKVSASVYTAVFMPANNSSGNALISVSDNAFTDLVGNLNADGDDSDNKVDITVAPTAIFRGVPSSVQPGSFNKMTIFLTEGSSNFSRSSILSSVALRGFRRISDTLYEVQYVAPRIGKISMGVISGSYTDADGVASIANSDGLDSISIDVSAVASYGSTTPSSSGRGGTTGIVVGRSRALPGIRSSAPVSSRLRFPQPVGRSASTGIRRRR